MSFLLVVLKCCIAVHITVYSLYNYVTSLNNMRIAPIGDCSVHQSYVLVS